MIFFCEINKTGQEHVMVNACFLHMISKYAGNQQLHLWVDKDHFKNYKQKPTNLITHYKKVIHPEKSNKLLWLLKLFCEMFMITEIVVKSKKVKASLVFFSSLSPVGNWYLSLLLPLLNRKTAFLVMMHGELELAKSHAWPKAIENFYGRLLRRCFKKNCVNRKFLLLGEVVFENVVEYGFLRKDQLIYIEHPYIFEDLHAKHLKIETPPIVFGHFGVAKLAKNSQLFFKLAKSMKDYIESGRVRFEVVGQVFDEMAPYVNSYVHYPESTNFLSRSEYNQKGINLNYSLFFYDEQAYEFTSSGAVLDAITFTTPIIALNIKLFDKVFESSDHCSPGFLFQDFEAMKAAMPEIVAKHEYNYKQMVECIASKKKLFEIDTQFIPFKNQLDEFILSN
jgi:hypothetical protein